jgi:hypothetical protein
VFESGTRWRAWRSLGLGKERGASTRNMSLDYCPKVLFRCQQRDLAIMLVPPVLGGLLRTLVHGGLQTCWGD